MFLVSKNKQLKNHQFLDKWGLAAKRFFLLNCVLKNVNSYRFFFAFFFGQILIDVPKTIKIGISAHFQKQKKRKKWPLSKIIIWANLMLLSGPGLLQHKMANLAQIITLEILVHIAFQKKLLKSLFL